MASTPQTIARPRLDHIDALRGLAALAVVFVHAFEIYNFGLPDVGDGTGGLTNSPAHMLIREVYDWFFRLGALAVPIFIMISGYSLMIPVARSASSLRSLGQLRTFFVRRIRRIVPPYYAALVMSLLIIFLVPGMGTPNEVYWDRALRNLDVMNIVAHLLLVHNLSLDWISGINPPFWSMAVEWQIYFLFPLLVLLWRRIGLIALLFLTTVYVVVTYLFAIPTLPFTNVEFVLLFVIGMAGAIVNFAPGRLETLLRERFPWRLAAWAGLLGVAGLQVGRLLFGLPIEPGRLMGLVAGAGLVALMIICTKNQLAGRQTVIGRMLGHRSLTWLGQISYSLYLVHLPILAMLALAARAMGLDVTPSYLLVFLVGPPASLLFTYGFHLIFERPFLNMPAAQQPAAPEPLPLSLTAPSGEGGAAQR